MEEDELQHKASSRIGPEEERTAGGGEAIGGERLPGAMCVSDSDDETVAQEMAKAR